MAREFQWKDGLGWPCLFVFLLAGCAGEETSGPPDPHVEGAWARAMPLLGETAPSGTNSAVYMVIRNDGESPERLLGAESSVATAVELHRSMMEEGVMRMRPVEELEIPAGGEVELRVGGLHLMLLGLTEDLVEGDTLALTLHFQRSGRLELRIPVLPVGGR